MAKQSETKTILDAKVKAPRAVIYARVSGDDRHNATSSIAGQIEQCKAYAGGNGYSVVKVVSEDANSNTSGADFDLPGVMEVIAMAERGEYDILIARDLDRLARDRIKHAIIERDLASNGVSVEYVNHRFDDSPEGDLSKAIMASLAEFERKKIKQRMHRGRLQSAKAGKKWGGRRAFGYDVSSDPDKPMEVNPSESVWVEKIFNWYVYGDENNGPLSLHNIAKRLNELGVKTTRGNKFTHYGVSCILDNEMYFGEWIVNRTHRATKNGKRVENLRPEWITIPVPPIVDKALFDKAKAMRAKSRKQRRAMPKNNYLLSGHIRCAKCGGVVTSNSSNPRKDARYHYYRCNNGCLSVPTHKAEKAVWEYLIKLMTNPTHLERELKAYQDAKGAKALPLKKRLATINELITQNQTKLNRLLDLYLDGALPKDIYTEKQAGLETTLTALQNEARTVQTELDNATLSDDAINDVLELAKALRLTMGFAGGDAIPFTEKRKILNLLEVEALLDRESVTVSCAIGLPVKTDNTIAQIKITSNKIAF